MIAVDERIKCFNCGKKKMEVTAYYIHGKEYIQKICTSCKFVNYRLITEVKKENGKK